MAASKSKLTHRSGEAVAQASYSRKNFAKLIDFLSILAGFVLGWREPYVMIQVNPDQLMTFGGTDEPCANVSLHCIGVVGPDKNKQLAPKLSKFIEQKLGIKQDRFYINVYDIPRAFCIWNGSTFG